MSFNKGDKVVMRWRPRFDVPISTWGQMKPTRGVIVGTNESKVLVRLANGDYIVHNEGEELTEQWATVEKEGRFSRFVGVIAPFFSR